MKDILTTYEEALGQTISLPKSEIYCSRNLSDSMKLTINKILGVHYVLDIGKYLGATIYGRAGWECNFLVYLR